MRFAESALSPGLAQSKHEQMLGSDLYCYSKQLWQQGGSPSG